MAEEEKNITINRKVRHEYSILQSFEAGIVLVGTEVKSCREGKVSLVDSYAQIKGNEVWLVGMHINPYKHGNINNHEPMRTRKLLLNASEIRKLIGKVKEKGLTLIPYRGKKNQILDKNEVYIFPRYVSIHRAKRYFKTFPFYLKKLYFSFLTFQKNNGKRIEVSPYK